MPPSGKDYKSSRSHRSRDSEHSGSRSRSRSGDDRRRRDHRDKDSDRERHRDNRDRTGDTRRFDSYRPDRSFRNDRDRGDRGDRNDRSDRGDKRDFNDFLKPSEPVPAGVSPPFQKNFLDEKVLSKKSSSEIAEWRATHKISVGNENGDSSKGIPNPIMSFDEVSSFPSNLISEFKRAGFTEPTSIQSQGWPIALSGHDLIGIAKTGSGKTLAFMIPAFVHLRAQAAPVSGEGPVALVLAPTRELAVQIFNECEKFGASSGIRVAVVYGGAEKYKQKRQLYKGVDIIIATPGRLIDLIEDGATNLRRVTYLVLDEADRMLDMGFEDQIRTIVAKIRPERQTLMWSATWPVEVKKLARELCNMDPIKIQVGSQDLAVNDKISQKVEVVNDEDEKKLKISEILKEYGKDDKILIFCQTKRGCDQLARNLDRAGFYANSLHGDKSQNERDRVMYDFKTGRKPILVATDLAARGLDIKDIKMVINYDMPSQIEDYIHRVGRTGRAGATGKSVSFFTPDNAKMANELVKILQETKQEVPSSLQQFMRRGGYGNQSSNRRFDYHSRDRGRGGFRSGGGSRGNYSGQRSSLNGNGGSYWKSPYATGTAAAFSTFNGGYNMPNPMMYNNTNAMQPEGTKTAADNSKAESGDNSLKITTVGPQTGMPGMNFATMLQNFTNQMVMNGLNNQTFIPPTVSQIPNDPMGTSNGLPANVGGNVSGNVTGAGKIQGNGEGRVQEERTGATSGVNQESAGPGGVGQNVYSGLVGQPNPAAFFASMGFNPALATGFPFVIGSQIQTAQPVKPENPENMGK